jgi:hypothetical protein
MAVWKKESTHCKDCGVEFDGTNKYRKRALCIECASIGYKTRKKEMNVKEHRHIKYAEFKMGNRNEIYSATLAETKGMSREEHLQWLTNRLNEIMENKKLWEYITTQSENTRKKAAYQKRKWNNSRNS